MSHGWQNKSTYSFVAIYFCCFIKNTEFHFYMSKELMNLVGIFYIPLSKWVQTKNITHFSISF